MHEPLCCGIISHKHALNELNAAYAADGYARIRGAALLSTTYGVAELSAINGVMGSKAHRLPVFHLVGMSSERIQRLGLITHHNLGDTVYDRFQSISASACCVSAVLTPDNCVNELERVIREALRQSMPAYIVISELHGNMPIAGTPVVGRPIGSIKRQHSVLAELDAAVGTVLEALVAGATPRPAAPLPRVEQAPMVGAAADAISSDSFYPRLQRQLRSGDTLVIETGTCMLHANRMLLPAGVGVEEQGLWGSIGWATPACLGVALAKMSGRTWLVTGDGSHQLTLNELAVMGRYGVKPRIFVLNNGLYGVEDVLSERGHPYDDLAQVNYHLLPEAVVAIGYKLRTPPVG